MWEKLQASLSWPAQSCLQTHSQTQKKGGKSRREGRGEGSGERNTDDNETACSGVREDKNWLSSTICQTKVVFINQVFGNKDLSWRDGLGAFTVLPEDQAGTSDSLQLPVTPTPGDLTPLDLMGICTCVMYPRGTHIYANN